MKRHTRIYLEYFGYDETDFIPCEVCGGKSVDIHHIKARGMGGDPKGKKDVIENLQALCRECHTNYGDQRAYRKMLNDYHKAKLNVHNRDKTTR